MNSITYKDHVSHYENSTINNITEVPQGEGSRSIVAEDENAIERERKRTFEFDEDSNEADTADFRMNSLYHYLYKLVSNSISVFIKNIHGLFQHPLFPPRVNWVVKKNCVRGLEEEGKRQLIDPGL